MSYPLTNMEDRIQGLLDIERPRLTRLWRYYRNPMRVVSVNTENSGSERPYRQAQEWGMPSRITGMRPGGDLESTQSVNGIARKEVVIENDIGWRIDTQVDYLFGRPLVIESAAPDPQRRQIIGNLLRLILAHNGGIMFLQQLGLLGSVYGFVDVLVKMDEAGLTGGEARFVAGGTQQLGQPPVHQKGDAAAQSAAADAAVESASSLDPSSNPAASIPSQHALQLARLSRMIRLEVVEPARALPIFSPDDCRIVQHYAQVFWMPRPAAADKPSAARRNWLQRLLGLSRANAIPWNEDRTLVVEILSPDRWQRYEDGALLAQGANSLHQLPLVHIQNTAVPFEYSGLSDVEPLIPIQDELNTRLSDRANRIALQSFKMYLGRGIENFTDLPVAPGRMWMSDNEQADVIEFGGDANCPSETNHIADLREAMDKISAVTPVAAGAIKNRLGRLTSAAALRITLLSLLSKTEKKRTAYGTAIQRLCELSLAWLDAAGLFPTTPDERRVELNWPSPLPQNDTERLQDASAKIDLGVPREQVLRELGY